MDEYNKALKLHQEFGNSQEVYDLLEQAAEQGDDRARYAIASWHLNGNEYIEKNVEKGFELMCKLKGSFIAEAHYDLAVSYDLGLDTKKNEKKAFRHYLIGALLGEEDSLDQISQYFDSAEYVPEDQFLAKFIKKLSKRGESARTNLK